MCGSRNWGTTLLYIYRRGSCRSVSKGIMKMEADQEPAPQARQRRVIGKERDGMRTLSTLFLRRSKEVGSRRR